MTTLQLIVDDIEAARDDLVRDGVDVSEIWHIEPGQGRAPGRDPDRRSYFSRASFVDPEGHTVTLEESTERLAGSAEMLQSGALAHLLFETGRRRGEFEAPAPPHDWWDWYAAYMDARAAGSIQERAAEVAGRYMAGLTRLVPALAR